MRTKLWLYLALLGFAFSSCEKDEELKGPPDHANSRANKEAVSFTENKALEVPADFENFENIEFSVDLIAGQHYLAGSVEVSFDESNMYVTYTTEDGWVLTETHLHVAAEFDGFPFAGSTYNPAIGHFSYSENHEYPGETSYTYTIPKDELPDLIGDCYFIAAHAVVLGESSEGAVDLVAFAGTLPEDVTVQITKFPRNEVENAYFEGIIISGGTLLDGEEYFGWCIETPTPIYRDEYTASVFSSYQEGLSYENMDKVNWLINEGLVGTSSDCGGVYNFSDVQLAIWDLLGEERAEGGIVRDENTDCRAADLVALANQNGEGYEPGCGDIIMIVLLIENAQNIIIEYTLPCYKDETAWGDGLRFVENGGNWATFFNVCSSNQ